jgi:hypothetical protein
MTRRANRSYTFGIRIDRERSAISAGGNVVQTARPRDVGALLFVIGLFLSLFLVTLLLPVR